MFVAASSNLCQTAAVPTKCAHLLDTLQQLQAISTLSHASARPCGLQAGGAWKGGSWGTQRAGGLTEAQIREELQNNGPDEIPYAVRNASNTVAWWRQRQAVIDLKVCFHHPEMFSTCVNQ